MLSSVRSAAKYGCRRVLGGYSGYTTSSQTFNPLFPSVSAQPSPSSANGLMDALDSPPSAEGGYSRAHLTAKVLGKDSTHMPPARIPQYKLHCFSSRNNTITTFTDPGGNPIAWYSGGSCGFKRGQRASYEAGYQCAVRIFKIIENTAAAKGMVRIALFFNGFGQGRDAMQKALMTSEGGNVKALVEVVGDRTPIKIGGTRSKKMRRL
ncbi:hypothetical protein C8J55DRAFT_218560 [Lentinula edodes]|uniref:Translational machinery component n=1 Tax=Lentinula lateritia TaxID=40482 RepID=A0A9W9AYN2_9AGAR|nr:hypothetical protein C8J55DRAFT_218560 [Lentinula edodes]